MKDFKFNPGDRVIAIENGEIKRGVVRSAYTDLINPMLIVGYDDGSVAKVSANNVALEPKAETKAETESENVKTETDEISDDKTITISYGEFRNIAVHTVVETTGKDIKLGLAMTAYSSVLAQKLFYPEAENA